MILVTPKFLLLAIFEHPAVSYKTTFLVILGSVRHRLEEKTTILECFFGIKKGSDCNSLRYFASSGTRKKKNIFQI